MPQPPSYDRTKDFAEDYGDNTDHVALTARRKASTQSAPIWPCCSVTMGR